jgi:hypothetical protein
VDAFQNYPNFLGFFAGNEVADVISSTSSMAYVKAAVRDFKAYIRKKNYRAIPVGYAINDDATIRTRVPNYLQCGDSASTADFKGLNLFS